MGYKKKYEGISTTYSKNKSSLGRFLRRFLDSSEDIEDTLHETFLKAYQAEQSVSIKSPRAFLFRTAKNLALNQLESKRARRTDSVANIEELRVSIDHDKGLELRAIMEEQLELALQAVANLPPRIREVYVLKKIHGLKQKDIAAQLGIAESTVEKHIAKGLMLITEEFIAKEKDNSTQPENIRKEKVHDTSS